jgi:SP family sugar:H+ symporter-like MFS transporter
MVIGSVIGVVAGVSGSNGYAGEFLLDKLASTLELSHVPIVFVVGRFILGFGLASFLMTSLIVVQEITHPRTRAVVASSWVRTLIDTRKALLIWLVRTRTIS